MSSMVRLENSSEASDIMDNKEAILDALNDFSRTPDQEIPQLLDGYLNQIGKTGETLFPWPQMKPLFIQKLDKAMQDFNQMAHTDHLEPNPNVDNVKFADMRQRILSTVERFHGAPFTIQRLCEMITDPKRHYNRSDKFLRGIEKNILVVTTVDPFGRKIVSESKGFLNGIDANGHTGLDNAQPHTSATHNNPPVPMWANTSWTNTKFTSEPDEALPPVPPSTPEKNLPDNQSEETEAVDETVHDSTSSSIQSCEIGQGDFINRPPLLTEMDDSKKESTELCDSEDEPCTEESTDDKAVASSDSDQDDVIESSSDIQNVSNVTDPVDSCSSEEHLEKCNASTDSQGFPDSASEDPSHDDTFSKEEHEPDPELTSNSEPVGEDVVVDTSHVCHEMAAETDTDDPQCPIFYESDECRLDVSTSSTASSELSPPEQESSGEETSGPSEDVSLDLSVEETSEASFMETSDTSIVETSVSLNTSQASPDSKEEISSKRDDEEVSSNTNQQDTPQISNDQAFHQQGSDIENRVVTDTSPPAKEESRQSPDTVQQTDETSAAIGEATEITSTAETEAVLGEPMDQE